MIFEDREEAGRLLAQRLAGYKDQKNVAVLGLARGGLPVAYEIAAVLNVPLDVFILRKLGVPGHEELAFGALASGGAEILDRDTVDAVGLSPAEVREAVTQAQHEIERRERLYRRHGRHVDVTGKTVILVDDGIATGSSIRVAIKALRKMEAARIVLAVPVAPPETCHRLQREADDVVCLYTPEAFYAVGAFYEDFSEVTDEDVIDLLRRASLFNSGKVA